MVISFGKKLEPNQDTTEELPKKINLFVVNMRERQPSHFPGHYIRYHRWVNES